MRPLAVDLCCGLGGWTHGLLAEGWDVVGFDIERHEYGDDRYPAQLVLQDILTIDGRQFKGKVSLITASPPCQEFSYMAMPWSRAKAIAAEYRSGVRDVKKLTALFDACVRIGREAECPIVIENVRGAQPWVGRSRWNFGSFHLWQDVPALMPTTKAVKVKIQTWSDYGKDGYKAQAFNGQKTPSGNCSEVLWKDRPIARYAHATPDEMEAHGFKVPGFRFDGSGRSFQSASVEGVKNIGVDGYARQHPDAFGWKIPRTNSKSSARKAASALIAKIPIELSRHIARVFRP